MSRTMNLVMSLPMLLFGTAGVSQADEGPGGLTVSVQVSDRHVLPFQPVRVRVTVSNETRNAVVSHTIFAPDDGLLDLYVVHPGGSAERLRSLRGIVGSYRGPLERTLEPGFQRHVAGVVYFNDSGNPDKEFGKYVFPEPGKYQLYAVLKDAAGKEAIRSAVVEVDVQIATGVDAQAQEFLKGVQERRFLLNEASSNSGDRVARILAKQEEFLAKFPDSHYAKYLFNTVGQSYLKGLGKGREAGIELLKRAAKESPEIAAAPALRTLIEVSLAENDLAGAKAYLKTLKERFPEAQGVTDCEIAVRNKEREQKQE
jgi:hypothetical protein